MLLLVPAWRLSQMVINEEEWMAVSLLDLINHSNLTGCLRYDSAQCCLNLE